MNDLYPLQFKTIFKEKIWGGQKLNKILKKAIPEDLNFGEAWELSAVPGNVSVVKNGKLAGKNLNEITSTYTTDLLGKKAYEKYGTQFPFLIKYLDANADLSVQVHPDDAYAKAHYGEDTLGKPEMWYVMQADEGAELILGFNKDIEKESFLQRVKQARLEEVLNKEKVAKGDVFFVPPGRIHNLGKGIMIAEIQQTSDLTFRVYDFDRMDKDGKQRELHLKEAMDVLDFSKATELKTYYDKTSTNAALVNNDIFCINKIQVNNKSLVRDYLTLDSFVILIATHGSGSLSADGFEFNMTLGDVFLLPATTNSLKINSLNGIEFLEVSIK